MKIFVSYSRKNLPIAEDIVARLRAAGHTVFFDRHTLPSGEAFDQLIKREIVSSDLFIFLISPSSVRKGGYSRTELRFAEIAWPNPKKRVLPVLIEETPFKDIPAYLRAVSFFEAEGNLTAELCDEVERRKPKVGKVAIASVAIFLALCISAAFYFWKPDPNDGKAKTDDPAHVSNPTPTPVPVVAQPGEKPTVPVPFPLPSDVDPSNPIVPSNAEEKHWHVFVPTTRNASIFASVPYKDSFGNLFTKHSFKTKKEADDFARPYTTANPPIAIGGPTQFTFLYTLDYGSDARWRFPSRNNYSFYGDVNPVKTAPPDPAPTQTENSKAHSGDANSLKAALKSSDPSEPAATKEKFYLLVPEKRYKIGEAEITYPLLSDGRYKSAWGGVLHLLSFNTLEEANATKPIHAEAEGPLDEAQKALRLTGLEKLSGFRNLTPAIPIK